MTLIEILISITLLAIITGITILALNPAKQIAGARNKDRSMHLTVIMNGIRQNMADNAGGKFTCASGDIPTTTAIMAATGTGTYNIGPCIVPLYMPSMPFDPNGTTTYYTSPTDYNSGYAVIKNASTGQVTISAPGAELGQSIFLTR